MNDVREPAVWFPAIHAGTGADVFTVTLAAELQKRGLRAEITWLPRHAEYAPWAVSVPKPPLWANIAHVNTWLHPRFIPKGLPVVATVHHCVHDQAFRPYKSIPQVLYHRMYIKHVERRILKRADMVVADSQYTAARTRAVFGSINISTITLGIDLVGPRQSRNLDVKHRPFRLLFVGSGSVRKGVDLLVPIMQRLGPQFELSVVGTSRIGKLSLPGNIHVEGRLAAKSDLADAYCTADALLFPSRLEGFGLVAVEAMAFGLPVIATRGSSLMEVVDDGVTGILCRQDDVAAFVEAARALAADGDLACAMSRAARKRVAKMFTVGRMTDDYIQVYRDCMC